MKYLKFFENYTDSEEDDNALKYISVSIRNGHTQGHHIDGDWKLIYNLDGKENLISKKIWNQAAEDVSNGFTKGQLMITDSNTGKILNGWWNLEVSVNNTLTENFKYIEIKKYDDEKVVKRLDVTDKSDRDIDRIEKGMNINLNHDKYYTFSYESETEKPKI